MNGQLVILAIDLGGVIFIVFAFVSFVSWILNQMNAAKGQPPRPQNRPGPRAQNPQIQREIDRFLREAAGQRQRPAVKVEDIEIVESPPRRRPPAQRKTGERPRPSGGVRPRKPPESPSRPGQDLASRHLAPAPLSTVAAEHLPKSRVTTDHLPDDVAKSVAAHLGVFAAEQMTAGQSSQQRRRQAAALVTALRTRHGMRSAIIMQEVLQRPRALRRRTH